MQILDNEHTRSPLFLTLLLEELIQFGRFSTLPVKVCVYLCARLLVYVCVFVCPTVCICIYVCMLVCVSLCMCGGEDMYFCFYACVIFFCARGSVSMCVMVKIKV